MRLAMTESELPVIVYGLMLSGSLRTTKAQASDEQPSLFLAAPSPSPAPPLPPAPRPTLPALKMGGRGSPKAHAHELGDARAGKDAGARGLELRQLNAAIDERFR